MMRKGRQFDADPVALAHLAALYDDPHDAGFADEVAPFFAAERRGHQPRLYPVQLAARVAQPGHLDDRRAAEMEPGAGRQSEQINAAHRDILAHLPGRDAEAGFAQFVMQFGMNEVDLAQIRLARIAFDARAVLHARAGMRVAFDAEPREQPDTLFVRLAHCVPGAAAHSDDHSLHRVLYSKVVKKSGTPLSPSLRAGGEREGPAEREGEGRAGCKLRLPHGANRPFTPGR